MYIIAQQSHELEYPWRNHTMCLTKEDVALARMPVMILSNCYVMDLNHPFNIWWTKLQINKDIFTNVLDLTKEVVNVKLSLTIIIIYPPSKFWSSKFFNLAYC